MTRPPLDPRDPDGLVAEWICRVGPQSSEHARLEVAAAAWRGAPLEPGEPVPGCNCDDCTGIPRALIAEAVARYPGDVPAAAAYVLARTAGSLDPLELLELVGAEDRARARRRARRDLRPAIDIDAVRRVPIAEVARRLGCGEPRRAGRELLVRCPLHEDSRPSMRLDPHRNVWYCDPCAEGGDGIRLWMRVRRCTFIEAARELAA